MYFQKNDISEALAAEVLAPPTVGKCALGLLAARLRILLPARLRILRTIPSHENTTTSSPPFPP
jgi:hypothetical protein